MYVGSTTQWEHEFLCFHCVRSMHYINKVPMPFMWPLETSITLCGSTPMSLTLCLLFQCSLLASNHNIVRLGEQRILTSINDSTILYCHKVEWNALFCRQSADKSCNRPHLGRAQVSPRGWRWQSRKSSPSSLNKLKPGTKQQNFQHTLQIVCSMEMKENIHKKW